MKNRQYWERRLGRDTRFKASVIKVFLGCSTRTVQRHLSSGLLRGERDENGTTWVDRADLIDFLIERRD